MTITPQQVANHLNLKNGPDEHMPPIVTAVNDMVTEWHGDQWPAGVELGAIMLAARLHRRRNSATGVESFSDMGAAYVSRWDTDLERQLRIGKWAYPAVG